MMDDDFWARMEGVSQIMSDLEKEHKRYFGIEEEKQLLNYKENFVKSCLFWNDANNVSDEEKMSRIKWEYNNMFDKLVELINNNVEEWEANNGFQAEEDEWQDPNKDF